MAVAALTPREVAELAGTPKRVVEKAIEERVLPVRSSRRGAGNGRRLLSTHAVVYATLVSKLDLKLSAALKRRFYGRIAALKPAELKRAKVELVQAVEVDVGRLAGDVLDRAERYLAVRDA